MSESQHFHTIILIYNCIWSGKFFYTHRCGTAAQRGNHPKLEICTYLFLCVKVCTVLLQTRRRQLLFDTTLQNVTYFIFQEIIKFWIPRHANNLLKYQPASSIILVSLPELILIPSNYISSPNPHYPFHFNIENSTIFAECLFGESSSMWICGIYIYCHR